MEPGREHIDIATSPDILETVVGTIVRSVLGDPAILARICDREDEVLHESRVADLLGVSVKQLGRMREAGQWHMVKGPGGWGMTRAQFREQRDLIYSLGRR